MIHDSLCIYDKTQTCVCEELANARLEERIKILKDSEEGKAYRMGRLDAASEVKRIANLIPVGSQYDPIWAALSAAVDAIERGVKNDNSPSDG